jgi:hypothetical protein
MTPEQEQEFRRFVTERSRALLAVVGLDGVTLTNPFTGSTRQVKAARSAEAAVPHQVVSAQTGPSGGLTGVAGRLGF